MLNKVEIRVNNIADAMTYAKYEIDEIGIGNEGCILKVPAIEQIDALLSTIDKPLKLILPFVPQKHIEKVKEFLKKIVDRKRKISLVINDLGVLFYLQTLDTRNIEIIVGRFLDWSYSLVPWGGNILRNETSDVFQYATQSSLYDDKKLALLKGMKVTGIELNATTRNIEVSSEFKKAGFALYVHYGYNILATSRACPFRRMEDKIQCSEDCSTLHEFSVKEKWMPSSTFTQGKAGTQNYHKDNRMDHFFPKMYLKNNMVFRKSDFTLDALLASPNVNLIINEELIENKEWMEEKLRGGK